MLRGIREHPEEIPQPAPRRIFQERQSITGLPLYFQGYLSVRHSKWQEFRVYWTELRGTMLFLYDDKKAPTYSQKLDISTLTSATNVYPDENGSGQFILMLPNEEVELKANDCERGKEWKGFILTVTKLSVPPDESLLPGQLTRMHEVLEKEKKRRIMLNNCSSASLNSKSPPSSTLTTMPACFYAVSWQEATEMLEKNPSCGNLILRPSSDSKNYAITIRHELDAPCLKHYKVMSTGTSYIVELERRTCLTHGLRNILLGLKKHLLLHHLLKKAPAVIEEHNSAENNLTSGDTPKPSGCYYFVTRTRGKLKPFVMQTRTAGDPVF